MTQIAEKILTEAMALDESERAELAAKLMDTLDPEIDTGYTEAWEAEIRERERQLDSGEVRAIPWEQARKMIEGGGTDNEAR